MKTSLQQVWDAREIKLRETRTHFLAYMKDANRWPFTCIDWDKAAQELQMDYTSVEFDGITYWVR